MIGYTLRLLSVCLLSIACLAPAAIAEDKQKDCGCEYCPLKVCDCGCKPAQTALSKPTLYTLHAALPVISDRHVAKYQAVEQPAQSQTCANGTCTTLSTSSGTTNFSQGSCSQGSCSQGSCPTSSQTTYVSNHTAYQGQSEFQESRRSRRGSSRGSFRGSCSNGGCR